RVLCNWPRSCVVSYVPLAGDRARAVAMASVCDSHTPLTCRRRWFPELPTAVASRTRGDRFSPLAPRAVHCPQELHWSCWCDATQCDRQLETLGDRRRSHSVRR